MLYFKTSLFSLFFFLSLVTKGQKTLQTQKPKSNVECLGTLEDYSQDWIRDSLGTCAFRLLLVKEVLDNCKFNGLEWSKISKFLGKPYYPPLVRGDEISYRYRVNYFPRGHASEPGNLFWRFVVKNGKIIICELLEIDG